MAFRRRKELLLSVKMFSSRLLLLFLSVYGLPAAKISQGGRDVSGSEGSGPTAGADGSLKEPLSEENEDSTDDIEDFMNRAFDNVVYAAHDYDDAVDDDYLDFIDPRFLSASYPDDSSDQSPAVNQTSD